MACGTASACDPNFDKDATDERDACSLTALAGLAALPALAQDNVVHVYNWSDYIAEDTVAKFEAETGIKVVYDVYDFERGAGGEAARRQLRLRRGGADLELPAAPDRGRASTSRSTSRSCRTSTNMDPELMEKAAAYDPGNEHAVIYMWGTTGIGYNVATVEERLGEDAPVDSWALVFDPQYAAKLADCGITVLDSLHRHAAERARLSRARPDEHGARRTWRRRRSCVRRCGRYIRYFHSSQYISDLANGEVCVSVGFSGDIFIAAARAEEAATASRSPTACRRKARSSGST